MTRTYKPGVVGSKDVPVEDHGSYHLTHYRGYMAEIRDRLRLVRHIQKFPNVSGVMQIEMMALQGRFLCELIARSIVCFHEVSNGEVAASRTAYTPKSIVGSLKGAHSWPEEINWKRHRDWSDVENIPDFHLKKQSRIAGVSGLERLFGSFGNVLHSQHRPRIVSQNILNAEQIMQEIARLDSFVRMHQIVNNEGFGVVANLESKAGDVLIVPFNSAVN